MSPPPSYSDSAGAQIAAGVGSTPRILEKNSGEYSGNITGNTGGGITTVDKEYTGNNGGSVTRIRLEYIGNTGRSVTRVHQEYTGNSQEVSPEYTTNTPGILMVSPHKPKIHQENRQSHHDKPIPDIDGPRTVSH